jgi:hypothetical protein
MSRANRVVSEVVLEEELSAADMSDGDDFETLPPSPDDIALVAMQGLLASGKYEDVAAACVVAWTVCVPAYHRGRTMFADQIAPIFAQSDKG